MKNVLDVLQERGYLKQTVYGDELYELLGKEKVTDTELPRSASLISSVESGEKELR